MYYIKYNTNLFTSTTQYKQKIMFWEKETEHYLKMTFKTLNLFDPCEEFEIFL